MTEQARKHWGPWTGGSPPRARRKTAPKAFKPCWKEQMKADNNETGQLTKTMNIQKTLGTQDTTLPNSFKLVERSKRRQLSTRQGSDQTP